ncbi:Protein NETWORKED 4A, partial [Cucurbita argyrosperma subsp. sororia]
MANSVSPSDRQLKRLESGKSHSWWWDSHLSPRNSRWLTENLEEMDRSIKRMLKLIEEDADSFAKKAEMYYQKRPVLISHVEEFYRMYRSLAERYDHVTGELRKNIPSDLQSQGSGICDLPSEPSSTWPSPDQRLGRRRSGPRAAGFDFFLGSGGSNDICQKEGDESSSLTESEPDSDDSSVYNYAGGDQGLNRKMIELEIELREAREKIRMKEENAESSFPFKGLTDENSDDAFARNREEELRNANEKLRISDIQIMRLKNKLLKYEQSELTKDFKAESVSATMADTKRHEDEVPLVINLESEVEEHRKGLEDDQVINVQGLVEELKITKEKLENSQKELCKLKLQHENNRSPEKICHLQDELEAARKDTATWKAKLTAEKREVSKLQERIVRLKASLSDRDHEIRDLNLAVSDAEQKIFPEKTQIKAEISRLLEERALLMEQLRKWEHQTRLLEDEIRKVKREKVVLEERLNREIQLLETTIVNKVECIENLKSGLDGFQSERDQLHSEVITLKENLSSKDKQVTKINEHVQKLERERVELVSGVEKANRRAEELRLREKELEGKVERQRVLIMEGAEEKREAIRQLCFSIEHYRREYHMLKEVFIGQKRALMSVS